MNPIFCAINMCYPSDFNECKIDQQCYYKCRSHNFVNTAQQASLRIRERKKSTQLIDKCLKRLLAWVNPNNPI